MTFTLRTQDPFKPSFSDKQKTYAHILGGARIASSGLEGALVENNLAHLISLLENGPKISDSLMANLRKCQIWTTKLDPRNGLWHDTCLEIAENAQALSPGESLLLPGGWRGDPYGHCMLYEIAKMDENAFRLRVIDTGTGDQFFSSFEDDRKKYRLPCLTYERIPKEKLLYGENNAALFLALMRLNLLKQSAEFDSKTIYQGLLKPLEEYRNDQQLINLKDRWITPQRAGTCSWNALKAYLRIYLDKEMYKEVFLFVEMETLKQLFNECETVSPSSQEPTYLNNVELLKIGCQSVSHYLQAIKNQRNTLDNEQIKRYEEFLVNAHHFLESIPRQDPQDRDFHRASFAVKECSISAIMPSTGYISSQNFNPRDLVFHKTLPHTISLSEVGFFVKELAGQKICQFHNNDYSYGNISQFRDVKNAWMHSVEEFSYRVNFYSNLEYSLENARNLINIFNCYIDQSKDAAFSPRQLNTTFTLYLLMWKGLCRSENLEENSFADFQCIHQLVSRLVPPKNLFETIDSNPFFLIFDPLDLARMDYLKQLLSSWGESQSLDPFARFSVRKIFPENSLDHEITFLATLRDSLKDEIKAAWTYHYRGTVGESIEQIGILGLYQENDWKKFFPLFYDLTLAHDKLMNGLRCVSRSSYSKMRSYENSGESIVLKFHPPYQRGVYFGYPIRYRINDEQQVFFEKTLNSSSSLLRDRAYESVCKGVHEVEIDDLISPNEINQNTSELYKNQEWTTFLKTCARLSTVHSLHFVSLLNLFTHHAHFLKKPEVRVFFLTQFFKITSPHDCVLRNEFESNPAIIEQILNFSDYIKQLALQQQDQEVDLELYLFSTLVLQESYRFMSYHTAIEQVLNERDQFLLDRIRAVFPYREADLQQQALFMMHVHRLYYYLVRHEKRPLRKEELFDVFSSYFAVKTFQTAPESQQYFLLSEIVPFIQRLLPLNDWNSDSDLTHLMICITEAMGFSQIAHNGSPQKISCDADGLLSSSWTNQEKITLCLSSAEVLVNGERLTCSERFTLKERKELFGDKLYPVYQAGQKLYLEHPSGLFKVNQSTRVPVIEFSPKDESSTYYFQGKEELEKETCPLPLSFVMNHQHFYDPKTREWVFIKDRNYASFSTALRWKPGTAHITSPTASDQQFKYACLESSELQRIEHPRWIQLKEHAGHQWIELPRYSLTFKVNPLDNKLVWENDPSFAVLELQNMEEPSLIEGFTQSLLLRDRQGKKLLILPSFPFKKALGLSSKGFIEFDPASTTCHYHTYRVKESDIGETILEPTDQESLLALAYYRVHERKYEEALILIREISPLDDLSEEGYRILEWLEAYGEDEKNSSPQALALSLHAYFLKKEKLCHQIEKNHSNEVISFSEKKESDEKKADKKVLGRLKKYYLVEAQIPLKLRLSQDQELLLIKKFNLTEELSLRFSTISQTEARLRSQIYRGDQNRIPKRKLGYLSYYNKLKINQHIPYFDDSRLPDPFEILSNVFFLYYQIIISKKWCSQEIEAHLWTKLTLKANESQESDLKLLLGFLWLQEDGMDLPLLPRNLTSEVEVKAFNDKCDKLISSWNQRKDHSTISTISHQIPSFVEICKSDSSSAIPSITHEKIDIEAEQPLNCLLNIHFPEIRLKEPLPKIALEINENLEDFEIACIEQEFDSINQDIEEGRRLLESEKVQQQLVQEFFPINSDGVSRLAKIKHKLEGFIGEMKRKVAATRAKLLTISNIDFSTSQLQNFHLDRLSGRSSKISLDMIEEAFFSGDFKVLSTHNPAFTQLSMQRDTLNLLLAYEIASVMGHMGQKAFDVLQAAQRAGISADEREYELLQLVGLLQGSLGDLTSYLNNADPKLDLTPLEVLIFARRSGLIPRRDQLDDVQTLCSQSCVLQKIMGGGKNAIIAALWLFVMSKRGYLPALFTDKSLYKLLGDSLKKSQKTSVGQEVFTVQIRHDHINEKELNQIEEDLIQGLKKKQVLLMCPETLQMLDLERQNLIERNEPKLQKTIDSLCRILAFFQNHVIGLGDEIDLLLRCDFEVNIPSGAKVRLLPKRIDLMKEIFRYFVTDEYLKAHVGLQENRQCLLTKSGYEEVTKRVAACLINHTPLKLKHVSEEIQKEFITFIAMKPSDKIPANFKTYVAQLKESSDPSSVEAAHLISLVRHTLQGLLGPIFKQTSGVNFGRYPGHNHGKIVPYLGVDAPTDRELAYHYEAVCKHMITAIQEGVNSEQLLSIYHHFEGNAQREMGLKKCLLESTDAYKDFKELVGVNMEEFFDEEATQEALRLINQNVENVLNIEAESAFLCVSYYEKYYHSSAQTFPHLVNSLYGMTGTPWNYEGFDPSLGHLKHDHGAEGKVIYTVLSRNTPIYSVRCSDIRSVIEAACGGGQPFPDALLDFAAFQKEQSPKETAREFLALAQEKGASHKQVILFFHRKPGETSSDRLVLGTFVEGNFEVEFLKHTAKNAILTELEQKGLTIDNCLVSYGQRQTTGADLPLPPTARLIITGHSRQELRGVCQALMRARQFCSKQTIDFVLLEEENNFIFGKQPQSITGLMSLAGVTQARKKAASLFRSFKQQITEVFASSYRKKICEGHVAEPIQICYDGVTKPTIEDQPYEAFFNEIIYRDPYLVIEAYAQHMLDNFTKKVIEAPKEHSQELNIEIEEISKKIQGILNRVSEKLSLLNQSVEDPTYTIGHDIENQVDVRVEVEAEEEVSNELVTELQTYQKSYGLIAYNPEPWWDEKEAQNSLEAFFQPLLAQEEFKAGVSSLPQLFLFAAYEHARHFEKMFPENLLATRMFRISLIDSWRSGAEKCQTIFHKSQKTAEQVLIVKTDLEKYLFILLSSAEASFFKIALKQFPRENTWLVSSNGRPFVEAPHPLNLSLPEVAKGLCYLNIFGGRASAIEDIPGGLLYFQMWLQGTLGSQKDRDDFVSLQSIIRPGVDQLKRLTKSISPNSIIGLRHALSPEEIPAVTDPEKIFLFGKDEIPHLIPAQVPYLNTQLLQFLKEPSLIRAVPLERLCYLKSASYASLSREQILYFSEGSLFDNLPLLPSEVFSILSKDDLFDRQNIVFFSNLSEAQKEHLTIQLEVADVPLIVEKKLNAFLRYCLRKEDLKDLDEAYVPFIDAELIQHFTDSQLTCLSENQVGCINHWSQIRRLPANLLQFLPLTAVQHLSENQISSGQENLTESQLSQLSRSQVKLITSPSVFQKLPPALLNHIKPEDTKHLSVKQVEENVNRLSQSHLSFLSPEQLGFVTSAPLIHRLERNQLLLLSPGSIPQLSPNQIREHADILTSDQLSKLDASQTNMITKPEVIQKLEGEQLAIINHSMIQELSQEQIQHYANHLDDSRLDVLSPLQVSWITQTDVIKMLKGLALTAIPIERISSLSVTQIRDFAEQLTPAQVQALNREQVQAITSKETIQQLRKEQLSDLLDDQLVHLSSEQVANLDQKATLQRLRSNQLSYVVVERVDAFSTTQISSYAGHLNAEQVRRLNGTQVKCIHNDATIKLLRKEQLPDLLDGQLVHLSSEQVAGLDQEATIQRLKDNQLSHVSVERVHAFSIAQIRSYAGHLKAEQVRRLNGAQVKCIHDDATIKRLRKEQLPDLLDGQLVHLSSEQVASLDEEQIIRRLPKAQLGHLNPACIPLLLNAQILQGLDELTDDQIMSLSEGQVGLVHSQDVIQKLSENQLPYVRINVIGLVSDDQVTQFSHLFTDEQLNGLPQAKLRLLDDATVINKLFPLKLKELVDPTQIQKIAEENLSHLTDAQLVHLSIDQVKALNEEEIIQRLPKAQLGYLNPARIPLLSNAQILQGFDELTDAQIVMLSEGQVGLVDSQDVIQKLSENQLPYVRINAIGLVSDNQVIHFSHLFTDEQLNGLPQAKLGLLDDATVINKLFPLKLKELVDPTQIQKIAEENLSHLTDAQLVHLSIDQVKALNEEEIIQRLPKAQLGYLNPARIPSLSNAQILQGLDELTEAQIVMLSEGQVGLVHSQDVIQKLSENQLPYVRINAIGLVSDNQVIHFSHLFTDEQLNGLPKAKLGLLDDATVINKLSPLKLKELVDPAQIQKITKKNLSHLTDAQLVHLSVDQVEALNEEEIIQRLPKAQLGYLNPARIPLLSNAQILQGLDELTDAQIVGLSPKQVGLIQNPEVIHKLSQNQLPSVDINAIGGFSNHQLKHFSHRLTAEQLNHLPSEMLGQIEDAKAINKLSVQRLRELVIPEQIQKIEGQVVNHLTNHQIKNLTKSQISQLQVAKISILGTHQLQDLTHAQVRHVSCLKACHLKGEQVQHATLWQTLFMKFSQFSHMRGSQKFIFALRSVVVLSSVFFAAWWIRRNARRFF